MKRDPLPLFRSNEEFTLEVTFQVVNSTYKISSIEIGDNFYIRLYPTEKETISHYIDRLLQKVTLADSKLHTVLIQSSPSNPCHYDHTEITQSQSKQQIRFTFTEQLPQEQQQTVYTALGTVIANEYGLNPIDDPNEQIKSLQISIQPRRKSQYTISGSIATTQPEAYHSDQDPILSELIRNMSLSTESSDNQSTIPISIKTDSIPLQTKDSTVATYLLEYLPTSLQPYDGISQTKLDEIDVNASGDVSLTYSKTLPFPLKEPESSSFLNRFSPLS